MKERRIILFWTGKAGFARHMHRVQCRLVEGSRNKGVSRFRFVRKALDNLFTGCQRFHRLWRISWCCDAFSLAEIKDCGVLQVRDGFYFVFVLFRCLFKHFQELPENNRGPAFAFFDAATY
jgi:hypothetical protein